MSDEIQTLRDKAAKWDRLLEIFRKWQPSWYGVDDNSTAFNAMRDFNQKVLDLIIKEE